MQIINRLLALSLFVLISTLSTQAFAVPTPPQPPTSFSTSSDGTPTDVL